MLELLYGAGLRVSELVGLDIDEVDLDDRTVRCIGKGDKERIVPIGGAAVDAVRRYLREGRRELASATRPTAALFLNANGGRLSRQSAWAVVKRYAAMVDPDARVFPHALRHSFATHLMARRGRRPGRPGGPRARPTLDDAGVYPGDERAAEGRLRGRASPRGGGVGGVRG